MATSKKTPSAQWQQTTEAQAQAETAACGREHLRHQGTPNLGTSIATPENKQSTTIRCSTYLGIFTGSKSFGSRAVFPTYGVS
jgi:hypothetical protein